MSINTNYTNFVSALFQAYAAPRFSNKEAIYAIYHLQSVAQQQEYTERNWHNKLYDTYKRPSKTQYVYLNKKLLLYTTQCNIMSDQIRKRIQTYKASLTADSNTPLLPI